MFHYWLLSRTNEYMFGSEFMVVSCLIGLDPLQGYGSWDLAHHEPFYTRSEAWQFHSTIEAIQIMV